MAQSRLLYIMENLVKTDTCNGNAFTFSNYLLEELKDDCNNAGCNDNVIFITTPNKENKDINQIGKVPVVKLGKDIYEGGRALSFPLKYLWKHQEEYTHIWTYTSRASSFWATLFKKLYGKKLILKCDSVVPDKNAKGLRRLWQYLTIKWPIKNADLIIAESEKVRSILQETCKKCGHIEVIPNCVHIKDINLNKFQHHIQNKENTIISIGRIEPIKGILDLIDAFSLLKQSVKYDNWKLKIIGPLTNEKYVRELRSRITELCLEKSVEFTGPKFGSELYDEMAKAKVYVIASHPLGDGRNNTLPYTLFFGCQPAITGIGTQTEMLNQLDIKTIEPCNIRALAKGLENAIINPKTIKYLQDYIRLELNWEDHLYKLNKVFNIL